MINYPIRLAVRADENAITQLIERSVRKLSIKDYTQAQIEGALKSAWGLDSQLIDDQSYFVVEQHKQIVGAGGWSYRKTLFGNNDEAARDSSLLNPEVDAAKIRAFFVAPEYARRGIGSLIMHHCEQAARKKGFTRLELMSTLPGKPLYQRHGFIAQSAVEYPLGNRLTIQFIPMTKTL
ncbi:GNAT family N-acetyltransferase [Aliikangiella coralliicola]|uniref:GNAT family N-acetyltransferase n=1 Tax=Aliikangiella coralliicola TaxID=2592383 RepID=A0A545UH20_9GAMM|nr:GNAT family N-acetyltransferase [Aliikangiella coralliicola]TQV88759.1 GNAT family N-acetyltransferase [Aliikangiella coralliicola]